MFTLEDFLNQAVESAPLATALHEFSRPIPPRTATLAGAVGAAQPFFVGLLARQLAMRRKSRLWIVCENSRHREKFHHQLLNWWPAALEFPELEISVAEGATPDSDSQAARLEAIERLGAATEFLVVVIHKNSWDQRVPAPDAITGETVVLQPGQQFVHDVFLRRLIEHGYTHVSQVTERGQVAVRGGIVDIFSWQASLPIRLDLLGDDIESLREFDVNTQTSLRAVNDAKLLLELPANLNATLRDYLGPKDALVTIVDRDPVTPPAAETEGVAIDLDDLGFFGPDLPALPTGHTESGISDAFARQVKERVAGWTRSGWKLAVFYQHDSEQTRVRNFITSDHEAPVELVFRQGPLAAGFQYPPGKIAVVTTRELFGGGGALSSAVAGGHSGRGAASAIKRSQIDFGELVEDQRVVHLNYGLARFLGVQSAGAPESVNDSDAPVATRAEEVLVLEFAEGAKLFVPLSQSFLVSRYVAHGKKGTALSRLGDARWSSAKKSAEKSVYDFAAKLLKLQAQRESQVGYAFDADTPWQSDFESTFPYTETVDQLRAITEVKADMESPRPMDRLICGDVGFGKTEVAIRAAFKAVMSGKQAAMMVPTTVLAQQHYENFAQRMEQFPVSLGLLSRFRTEAEQHRTLTGLKDGSVDLVIGTHRLISEDVIFKDLGLLIVDEEQRFGVRHKERIKNRYPLIDILTLSATPIPRTLYLSLVGTRDLSTLETPPPNRFAVETVVCPYDERVIRNAIQRELGRQGQVYFLHNRIQSIARVRDRLSQLCPQARIDLGHGQMEEGELEDVMHRFVKGETDVLVATTIIESGLDIPNANTIVIDRADRFGLADLYQLRGRVGRGAHKAYAFLMLPRELMMAPESRKRLSAIRQYSALGAGFKIALRDLEIRGAGNILGVAQSGHITAVGFELYCQLLRQAVSRLKGDTVRARLDVTLRLDFVADTESAFLENPGLLPAFLPAKYLEDPRLRIQAYRGVAEVSDVNQLAALRASWRDRFGPLPTPVENLLGLTELKIAAAAKGVSHVETRGEKLMLTRRGDYVIHRGRFPRLTSPKPNSRLREILLRLREMPASNQGT